MASVVGAKLRARFEQASVGARLFAAVVAFLLASGLLLRSLGYFDDSNGLWNDEANWVLRMRAGVSGGNIRPPGYLLLSKLIIRSFPTEQLLRLPSYLAGLASLLVFLALARLAKFGRVATAFGLAILALHPWAIAYAKEFKPYGPELLAGLALITVALRYEQSPTRKNLLLLCVVAPLGVAFAWSAVFLLPGIFLTVVVLQYRRRARLELALTLGAAVLGAVVIVLLHLKRFKSLFAGKTPSGEGYWGRKYGVFFLERKNPIGKLRWMTEQTWDVFRFPGELHAGYSGGEQLALGLGLVVAALGLLGLVVLIVRKDLVRGLLFVSPWLVTILANWLGVWPYGVFRTNVFLLAYPLLLACVTLDELGKSLSERRVGLGVAALLLPFAPVDLRYFSTKDVATNAFASSIGTSMADVQEREAHGGKVALYLDGYACGTYRYYTKVHPRFSKTLRKLAGRAQVTCSGNEPRELVEKLTKRGTKRAWIVTARPASKPLIRPLLEKNFHVRYERPLATPDTLFLVERRASNSTASVP